MQFCISTTIFMMIVKFCQIEVLGGTRSTNEKKIWNLFFFDFFNSIFKCRFLYNYWSDWCQILTNYSLRRGELNSGKRLFGKKMYFLIFFVQKLYKFFFTLFKIVFLFFVKKYIAAADNFIRIFFLLLGTRCTLIFI